MVARPAVERRTPLACGLRCRDPMRASLAELLFGSVTAVGAVGAVGAAGALGAGCTQTGYVGAGPCDSPNADPACATSCTTTPDCPTGFFCGPEQVCTAECSATEGTGCASGEHCDEHGACVDDVECPSVVVSPVARTPTVQLVIDRSGSMLDGFGGTNRWAAVRTALTGPSGVVTQLEDRVLFGATTYSSNRSGACPDLEATPTRAFGNRAAIDTLLTHAPLTDTPTGESLRPVIDELVAARPPEGDYTPIILLATDGMPDTCANVEENGNTAAQNLSISETERAFTNGVKTYILSVGNQVGDPHLQKVANAGAGQPIATGTAPFYKANDPAQLTAALRAIITGAISCQLDLSGNIVDQAEAEATGIVTLGGVPLMVGTEWHLVDENTIELLGAACDRFRAGDATLVAEFGCGVIIN